MNSRRYRLRASPFRRCYRAWIRHEGRIVRLLVTHDYRACEHGGEPRDFFKRITHRRWPKGWHMHGAEWSKELTGQYASLPADQWIELTYAAAEAA